MDVEELQHLFCFVSHIQTESFKPKVSATTISYNVWLCNMHTDLLKERGFYPLNITALNILEHFPKETTLTILERFMRNANF